MNEDFKITSAHEIGHQLLFEYAQGFKELFINQKKLLKTIKKKLKRN